MTCWHTGRLSLLGASTTVAVALAIATVGCGQQPDVGTEIGAVSPVSPGQPVTPIEPDRGRGGEADGGPPDSGPAPDPIDSSYEAMCRNYCEALERTNLYACFAGGQRTAEECVALTAGMTASLCFELRCVPKRVEPALCLTQCGIAARHYGQICGADVDPATRPAAPICSPEADAKNAACEARCALEPPAA